MAKKKLTPFEKAQRQFVQARLAETGLEASPETRQRFRQRFETLAAEKQGRTKLAQKLLPTAAPEERKGFKRMLATEMPARGDVGGGTGGGTTPSYKVPTAKDITAGWQQAVKSGSYKVPTPAVKAPTVSTQQTSTTSSKSKGNVFTNRRQNVIGKGINYPGRTFVEGVTNPLGNVGAIKDWSPKGLAKVAGQELSEAASVVSTALTAGAGLKAVTSVGRFAVSGKFGLKNLLSRIPKLGDASINRSGGVGKGPYGPSVPPAPSSPVSAATSAGKSTALPKTNLRLNQKGGYGSKSYGPQVPASTKAPTSLPKGTTNKFGGVGNRTYGPPKPAATKPAATKPAATKPAATKPAATKPATSKPASTKAPKISKADAEDLAYQAAQAKNRFPGATDKDMSFIQKLNRAQQAIENKSAGYQNYANWLKNPETQATLARLRRK